MKLACIVLAHRGPEQLAQLLCAVRHRHVEVYLHLDRRVHLKPFARALAQRGLDDVVLLPRQATRWGGVELVDAALSGLARGADDKCTYFMLISGQDLPLRPIEEILEFAERAGPRSFLEHFALPTPRWRAGGRDRTDYYSYNVLGRRETCIPWGRDTSSLSRTGSILNGLLRLRGTFKPSRRFPHYANPYGGSQWWNLSRPAALEVLRFMERHPDYRHYHEHTLAPDEMFFQSIVVGTDNAVRDSVVSDSLRFLIWSEDESHPRILTGGDVPLMLASKKLFARKVDTAVDAVVAERLLEHVAK